MPGTERPAFLLKLFSDRLRPSGRWLAFLRLCILGPWGLSICSGQGLGQHALCPTGPLAVSQ